jgi:hypothetical protein
VPTAWALGAGPPRDAAWWGRPGRRGDAARGVRRRRRDWRRFARRRAGGRRRPGRRPRAPGCCPRAGGAVRPPVSAPVVFRGSGCFLPRRLFFMLAPQRHPVGGEAAAVVVAVVDGWIVGASFGDAGAWLIGDAGRVELTAGQHRRPLLGSGALRQVSLALARARGRLVLATDGAWNCAPLEGIASAVELCDWRIPPVGSPVGAWRRGCGTFALGGAGAPTVPPSVRRGPAAGGRERRRGRRVDVAGRADQGVDMYVGCRRSSWCRKAETGAYPGR